MSATQGVRHAIDHATPTDRTPVTLHADALESTAPEYLRDLKFELASEDLLPAELVVEADFPADDSLSTQEEADRLRSYVRAAAFLGVGTLRVDLDTVANAAKVRPALDACAERARRDGVQFTVDGPLSLT
ncbi:MAG: hypothetical protein ABEJ57_04885 [Halobacteriaceae archaeon]